MRGPSGPSAGLFGTGTGGGGGGGGGLRSPPSSLDAITSDTLAGLGVGTSHSFQGHSSTQYFTPSPSSPSFSGLFPTQSVESLSAKVTPDFSLGLTSDLSLGHLHVSTSDANVNAIDALSATLATPPAHVSVFSQVSVCRSIYYYSTLVALACHISLLSHLSHFAQF